MLFPIEDTDSWARKYDLPIQDDECKNCGDMYSIDVPFATKNHRGLIMADHGCPDHFRKIRFTGRPE